MTAQKPLHVWRTVQLSEICTLVNGRGFKPHEWGKSGLPIIRIQNLNGNETFNYYAGDYDPKIQVENGELLFAWSGSKGTSFGPHIWCGSRALLNYHTWKVEVHPNAAKDFLFQMLELLTYQIESNTHGQASLVHTQKAEMERVEILLPSLAEQRRIAAVLKTWDGAIDALDRLIAAKERQLLDLRGILFRPDVEADAATFGDILSESREPGSNGATARKLSVKLYGRGVAAKVDRTAGSENTLYYRRRAGQLIYSKLDFLNGAFGLVPRDLDGFETTLDLPAFDVNERVNARWLVEYLTRPIYYENQTDLARGQRVARRVNPPDFLGSGIDLPPRASQDRVVEVIDAARSDLEQTIATREALRRQKRGLMQKLLTGAWRVPETQTRETAA